MLMKKWLAFLLAAVMLFSLCSCGDNSENGKTEISQSPQSATSSTTNILDLFTTQSTPITSMTNAPETPMPLSDTIMNIGLLGLNEQTTLEAVMILTIDNRDQNKPRVKTTSIDCNTLVYMEGYTGKDSRAKLSNIFDLGYQKAKRADIDHKMTEENYKYEGVKTAIRTINNNFKLNISHYAYVNFFEFEKFIDFFGGVTINVAEREISEMNHIIKADNSANGSSIATITTAGEQILNGGQALAYSRVRKIDSSLKRTQRQRDILKAVYNKTKDTPVQALPEVIARVMELCHTNLTKEELVAIGAWVVTGKPEILNYTLPDMETNLGSSWIWEGTHSDYGWVWIYDLDYASALLIDFIYDKNTAEDLPKPTMPDEPKVTAPQN